MTDRVPAVGDNIKLWCCGSELIPYTQGQPLLGTISVVRASGYVDVNVTDALGAPQGVHALPLVKPGGDMPERSGYVEWA